MKTTTAIALLALVSSAFSTAHAQLIYADTFQYGYGYPGISGQTPTVYDGTGAKWTGNGGYLFTNGDNSALLTSSNGDAIAYLPVTLATNTEYTYGLTLAPSSTNSWQEMGFIDTSSASAGESVFSGNLGPALIYGPGAGGIQLFNGAVATNPIGVPTPSDAQANNPQNFTFVLDTGATLGTYTYSVFDTDSQNNTTTLASDVSYTGTISGVQLGTFYEFGSASNFFVSSTPIVAPEPSTTCLLLAGGLALVALQRRVRANRL